MNKKDDFNAAIRQATTALDELMTTNVLSNDDKAILRVNRFKRWLLEYQHLTNDDTQTTIEFTNN